MGPRKRHILIVEDDEAIREGLEQLVEEAGYVSSGASNGAHALEQLRGGVRPAVILLDLMMPVMNGWDFRNAQLEDPELAGIPVVVLSDFGEDAAAAAADEVLPKPFTVAELVDVLHRIAP